MSRRGRKAWDRAARNEIVLRIGLSVRSHAPAGNVDEFEVLDSLVRQLFTRPVERGNRDLMHALGAPYRPSEARCPPVFSDPFDVGVDFQGDAALE